MSNSTAQALAGWLASGAHCEAPTQKGFLAIWVDSSGRLARVAAGLDLSIPGAFRRLGKTIAIAPSLRALVDLDRQTANVFLPAAASAMFSWIWRPTDNEETPFREIHRIPPGWVVDFGWPELTRLHPWHDSWRWRVDIESFDEAAPIAMRNAIQSALVDSLPTDSRVAVAMSGGLDSTSLAALAAGPLQRDVDAHLHVPLASAMSARLGVDPDDTPWARKVAARFPRISLHSHPTDPACSLISTLRDGIWNTAAPMANPWSLCWWRQVSAAAAADGARQLVTGQSGNTTFSGPPVWQQKTAAGFRLGRSWEPSLVGARLRRIRDFGRGRSRSARAQAGTELIARTRLAGLRPETTELMDRRTWSLPASPTEAILTAMARGVPSPFSLAAYTPGIALSDPLGHPGVVGVAISVPDGAWCTDGLTRSLARRSARGLLPEEVRLRRSRGSQAADVPVVRRLQRAEFLFAIDEISGSPTASAAVDADVLRSSLAIWDIADPALQTSWSNYEGRVLALGLYLAWWDQYRSGPADPVRF